METVNSAATGLSPGRRWLILLICCMSVFVVGIDVTIVNAGLGITVFLVGLISAGRRARDAAARNAVRLAQRAKETTDDQSVTAAR